MHTTDAMVNWVLTDSAMAKMASDTARIFLKNTDAKKSISVLARALENYFGMHQPEILEPYASLMLVSLSHVDWNRVAGAVVESVQEIDTYERRME